MKLFSWLLMFILVFGSLANVSALGSYNSIIQSTRPTFGTTYTQEQRSTYWPVLGDQANCEARTDLILQVAPVGCQPVTVPSELLAEQNVPVFCQVDALQINPLLDIEQIENIRFKGDYPDSVVGAGFHPARAALRDRDMMVDGPLINNIGYVVVILRKTPNEDEQPDFVNLNLTAQVGYESGYSLGVGKAEFKLPLLSGEEWEDNKMNYGFWNGKYFLKLESLDEGLATISVYLGDDKITTQRIELKDTSDTIYVPGSYCQTGMNLRFNDLEIAENSVTLDLISEDVRERVVLYDGSKFLNGKCSVQDIRMENGKKEAELKCRGATDFILEEVDVKDVDGVNNGELEENQKKALDEAIAAYREVVEDYPNERDADVVAADYYGEKALLKAISLAEAFNQNNLRLELISELKDKYANSLNFVAEGENLGTSEVRRIDNADWTIKLADIQILSEEDLPKAEFDFGSKRISLTENGVHSSEDDKIILSDLDVDSVRIRTDCNDEDDVLFEEMKLGESRTVCGKVLVLRNIDAKKVAAVSVIPRADDTETEANLSVNIGISKRDIELSPEKAKSRAEKLNDTIEKFENINDRLSKTVENMKAACFATSAAFTAWNLLTGFGGESLARSEVMGGANGWTQRCASMVAEGKYTNLDVCYAENSDEIDEAVKQRAETIGEVNDVIDKYEDENKDGLFGSVDDSGFRESYKKHMLDNYGGEEVMVGGGKSKKVSELLGSGNPSITQMRNLQASLELKESNDEFTSQKAESDLVAIGAKLNNNAEQKKALENYSGKRVGVTSVTSDGYANARSGDVRSVNEMDEIIEGGLSFNNEDVTDAAIVSVSGKGEMVVGLDGAGNVKDIKMLKSENGKISLDADTFGGYDVEEFKREVAGSIIQAEYNNEIVSSIDGDVKVKYFEKEPYKGMPALVPFDKNNGWYVQTRQTLPVHGSSQKAYDSSGRPANFYICNVGIDGRIDGLETDECRMFNVNTASVQGTFPGLSESETNGLVKEGIEALKDAANQYGDRVVRINGESYGVGTAAEVPATQCQDFMSPDQCQTLYNVCDPVICPSSRCDFGGKYPVADVIQSGIVGSTLLCLPNFKLFGGDVYVPVCLSGINAGIEGYLSILKGYQGCLIERATSGRLVGLCDQVYSINLCEFFWRQAAPLIKVLVPRLVEFAYGQSAAGSRGGGEYATVQAAWENAQNSIRYMTQEYAANSLSAFQLGSIEEVGSQFCRASASASFPTSFETLTEADSPSQFHAWFSSTRYSDATVPATAQYKVFYNIYAGKEKGIYYNVYLKNPPQFASVSVPSVVQVDSGYISVGGTKQESKDFTAPEGYKELCVSIDGIEECGFKQVSTSFASNILADGYVQDQAGRTDINDESECISGSASISPSTIYTSAGDVQGSVEGAIDPQIYNRGIVRICSSSNPGEGTNPNRYKRVGNCGNENIGCWLDKDSVEDAISDSNKGQLNLSSITTLEAYTKEGFEKEGNYRYSDSVAVVSAVEKEVDNLNPAGAVSQKDKMLEKIANVTSKLILNHHKARMALTRAKLLDKAARSYLDVEESRPLTDEDDDGDDVEVTNEGDEKGTREDLINLINFIVDNPPVEEIVLDVSKECDRVELLLNGDLKYSGDSGVKKVSLGSLHDGNYDCIVNCIDMGWFGFFGGEIIYSETGVFEMYNEKFYRGEAPQHLKERTGDDYSLFISYFEFIDSRADVQNKILKNSDPTKFYLLHTGENNVIFRYDNLQVGKVNCEEGRCIIKKIVYGSESATRSIMGKEDSIMWDELDGLRIEGFNLVE